MYIVSILKVLSNYLGNAKNNDQNVLARETLMSNDENGEPSAKKTRQNNI